jgi:signal peptidase I/DNA-directed RNA polymerase subunit RPC12/RpoP
MPDEHIPLPPSQPGASIRPAAADGLPAPRAGAPEGNGPPPETNGVPSRNDEPAPSSGTVAELRRLAGWCVGLVLVLACGWVLVGGALWLTQGSTRDMVLAGGFAALLSLGLFLFLERELWLSRLMGLRLGPHSAPWKEALILWLFGVLGLLFRSTAPSPTAQASAGTKTRGQPATPPVDSVREVIETVVFVVVLVLMLKSFAAEAFVIPTGSMAETLWGYQKVVECPSCGIKFPVNCSSEVDPSEGQKRDPVVGCTCPNCRQRILFPNAPRDLWFNRDAIEIPDPGWNSGDRVLVAKFIYDLVSRDPDRLDVVVFKFPGDSSPSEPFPSSGPYKDQVPMNYIKRLIGLPGETIAIYGGNVYVLPAEKSPPWDDFKEAKNDPQKLAVLWQKDHMHIDSEKARRLWEAGQFQIVRKAPETLLAMMRLVFDNDHPGKGLPERWAGEDWQAEGRGFRSGRHEDKTTWLRYSHTPNREKSSQRELITDFMGYNTFINSRHDRPLGENWASDLILECEATLPDNPAGELTLELSRSTNRFRARFDLASGLCSLYRVNDSGEKKLGESKPTLKGKGTYRLRFANVDQRLTVWVDGRLPFEQGVSYDHPGLGPRAENDLEPASIGVQGASVQVRKLKVFRDTYYTTKPSGADASGFEPGNPDTWAGLSTLPLLTMYVQPEHYLCLGDNSPESSDGRSWGTVPKRLLLGRAVMVYYPFSRAGRIR